VKETLRITNAERNPVYHCAMEINMAIKNKQCINQNINQYSKRKYDGWLQETHNGLEDSHDGSKSNRKNSQNIFEHMLQLSLTIIAPSVVAK